LIAHNGGVIKNEFSEDGTLLASGGLDKIVRLWPIGNSTGNEKDTIIPIKMKTIHEPCIYCLAISSDNRRLFSGEKNGNVFIHDIPTLVYNLVYPSINFYSIVRNLLYCNSRAKRTHTIGDVKCAWSISVNPESDGNTFALAYCLDDIIRISDICCNTSRRFGYFRFIP
jgi:WD40 repeat protein